MAQTVHETHQGVDARTGLSRDAHVSGVLLGAAAKAVTRQRLAMRGSKDGVAPGEHLIPVFGTGKYDGQVVGWERPMKPAQLKAADFDTHLGRMLGVSMDLPPRKARPGEFGPTCPP